MLPQQAEREVFLETTVKASLGLHSSMLQSKERLVNESHGSSTRVCVGIISTLCLISGYDSWDSVALVRELELCDPQVLSPRQWALCLPQKETERVEQVDVCIAPPTGSSTSFSVLRARPALTSKHVPF